MAYKEKKVEKCLECGKKEPMSALTIKNGALCYDCKQRQKQKRSSEKYYGKKPVKMCHNNCGKEALKRKYCEECQKLIKSMKNKKKRD